MASGEAKMSPGVYRRRLERIIERCYQETRQLEPGSVPESDALWTYMEEAMQLTAAYHGEAWKTAAAKESSDLEDFLGVHR
jgi:hypothetical protein